MKKVVTGLVHLVLTVAFVAYIAYQFRTDPIGPLSGRELSGEEAPYPGDWGFIDEHPLVAVETRPGSPHSVTTLAFIHDGALHIPARDGSKKDWPAYVEADPRVRIKVGDMIYPAQLTRVRDANPHSVRAAISSKYPGMEMPPVSASVRFQEAMDGESEEEGEGLELWLFRVSEREI